LTALDRGSCAALLATQPVPAGDRIGVVSNTRGGLVLAADACADAGLQVASLTEDTQRALRDLLGREAVVAGPVDTTVLVAPGSFRRCLELVGADPGVDVVLALTATTAGGDLVPEVAAAQLPVPIAAAVMDQVEVVRLLPSPGRDSAPVPAYAYPRSAARALGHAARYGCWRSAPPGHMADLDGLRQERAAELVADFLARPSRGGWLTQQATAELLLLRRAAGRQHRGDHRGCRARRGSSVRRSHRAPGRRTRPAACQRRPQRADRPARPG
jgi:acyl-CoA synthetase (NDP forming)